MLTKHKHFKFEIKATDDRGVVEGYASTFGNIDHGNDIVVKGAFTKTLSEQAKLEKIKIYWNHLAGTEQLPIGVLTDGHEDEHGLFVKIKMDMADDFAVKIYNKLKQGFLDSFSIGYRVIKDKWEKGGIRKLLEVALHEISVVDYPMNPAATVVAVKSDNLKKAADLDSTLYEQTMSSEPYRLMSAFSQTMEEILFSEMSAEEKTGRLKQAAESFAMHFYGWSDEAYERGLLKSADFANNIKLLQEHANGASLQNAQEPSEDTPAAVGAEAQDIDPEAVARHIREMTMRMAIRNACHTTE